MEDMEPRRAATDLRALILVEGVSDRFALETLASRRRIALRANGISVVPMGGAGNIGRYLERFGPHGSGLAIAGLYDAAEEADIRRALERAGSDPLALAPTWRGSGSTPAARTSRTS
jgi:hypothetical protein